MMGFGGFSMIPMIIFWVLVVALAIWLLGALFPSMGSDQRGRPGPGDADSSSTALKLLNERYARGEITKEEYHDARRDLISQWIRFLDHGFARLKAGAARYAE